MEDIRGKISFRRLIVTTVTFDSSVSFSRSAVVTINGSIGGGILGMVYRWLIQKWCYDLCMKFFLCTWRLTCRLSGFSFSYVFCEKKLNISIFVTGILSGLVSITGKTWNQLYISEIPLRLNSRVYLKQYSKMCEMEWVIINTWPVELKMPRTCHRAPEKRKTIVSWRLSQCFFSNFTFNI